MARRTLFLGALLLALAGCGGSGSVLRGYGVSLEVPPGWHARVSRGAWLLTSGQPRITVALYEDTADSDWSPPLEPGTYRVGSPRGFGERELENRNGAVRNFALAGRYFDLFVETHARPPSSSRIGQLDALVRSLRVRRGDFYPGRVQPARFRPHEGWIVRDSGSLPLGTDDFTVTVAATLPWRDALNDAEPSRSLARLRQTDGIAIEVVLDADNRFPPSLRSTKLRLGPIGPLVIPAGPTVPGLSSQAGSGTVGREYTVTVTVIYGRSWPTRSQRAHARAELARLVLPRWPHWS